ncbi:hypothetical protein BT69DRAFT_1289761 [Atractiella rhizophila]|nr:hypothetical protein BT69DRAFT_1289761 [Atractiella rhizophila]
MVRLRQVCTLFLHVLLCLCPFSCTNHCQNRFTALLTKLTSYLSLAEMLGMHRRVQVSQSGWQVSKGPSQMCNP